MRWIWIDRIERFTPGESAVAVKCVSHAEDHIHDLYPPFPIAPNSLIIEGMAQLAGLVVGEVRQFREKVVLAKITRATFHRLVRPGQTIRLEARIENLSVQGASITGQVDSEHGLVAEIEMMFSHADHNSAGLRLPPENFVFTPQFLGLLKQMGRHLDVPINGDGAAHAR